MQLHLVTKEIWNVAMTLHRYYLPLWLIDWIVLLMCRVVLGDTSRYGLRRPAVGPFSMKINTPAYPVVDVGTFAKMKTGAGGFYSSPSLKKYHQTRFLAWW